MPKNIRAQSNHTTLTCEHKLRSRNTTPHHVIEWCLECSLILSQKPRAVMVNRTVHHENDDTWEEHRGER